MFLQSKIKKPKQATFIEWLRFVDNNNTSNLWWRVSAQIQNQFFLKNMPIKVLIK